MRACVFGGKKGETSSERLLDIMSVLHSLGGESIQ